MTWRVPQFVPALGEAEAEAAARCVRSGWITEGPLCEQFVERIKALAGVKYGVLAPNGTLALYLALKACGIGPGDEVLVPDLTFVATATAVVMAEATPVFVDVNEYGHWSAEAAERAREGVRDATAGAWLPVHLYGSAGVEWAEQVRPDGVWCIEDACQALGVTRQGQACGSFGHASAFSFFADKTITTGGEGGFVGTNDPKIYERLRYLRNQGRLERGSFVHPAIGQNFRLTDLQAAVGLAQLDRFEEIIQRKRQVHQVYTEELTGVVRVLQPPPGSTHIPFRTVVFFDRPATQAADFLYARGIEPRTAFMPLHRQPCFAYLKNDERHADGLFPQATYFWDRALCLPTFPGLTAEQLELVCGAVRDFVAGKPA